MTPPLEPSAFASAAADPPAPHRHGGLTAGLVMTLIFNAVAAPVFFLVGSSFFRQLPSSDPVDNALIYAPSVLATANVACVIALLKNKKWGFWGLCATSILWVPVLYKLGGGIGAGLFGLVGLAYVSFLYGLLNLGDANTKTWPRLR